MAIETVQNGLSLHVRPLLGVIKERYSPSPCYFYFFLIGSAHEAGKSWKNSTFELHEFFVWRVFVKLIVREGSYS